MVIMYLISEIKCEPINLKKLGVYIAIDAVYVVEQSKNHIKGGKPEMKTKKTRIGHWNISVEFDGLRYCVTALTRKEVF